MCAAVLWVVIARRLLFLDLEIECMVQAIKLGVWGSVALALFNVVACSQSPQAVSGTGDELQGKVVLTGSSTVAPLTAELGKRFETEHPQVRVDVQTGGRHEELRMHAMAVPILAWCHGICNRRKVI